MEEDVAHEYLAIQERRQRGKEGSKKVGMLGGRSGG
jgi:hypothetical protein